MYVTITCRCYPQSYKEPRYFHPSSIIHIYLTKHFLLGTNTHDHHFYSSKGSSSLLEPNIYTVMTFVLCLFTLAESMQKQYKW